MHPFLLQGHSRPVTHVKFNRQGDLLFTGSMDKTVQVWYTDNGERLGTYNGHEGTIWDCDINFDSTRLLTGSADTTAKLWDLQTGQVLCEFPHKSSVRSVAFAHGDRMILTVQDNTYNQIPTIFIYNLAADANEQGEAVREIQIRDKDPKSNKYVTIKRAVWGSLNHTVIGACSDGTVRMWEVQEGKEICRTVPEDSHRQEITDMQLSRDRTMAITSSADYHAKLWDIRDKKLVLKRTFRSDHPLNSASISPRYNQVIVGGGQDAMNVTTTAAGAGHFETEFYHTVFQEKIGTVSGHFGTMNTLAFSPTGQAFATGAVDGYVRLHLFTDNYYKNSEKYNWATKKVAAAPE